MPAKSDTTRNESAAPPAEIARALPGARQVGCGRLTFFGLTVYGARLWAPAGFDAQVYERCAFALDLEYARRLNGRTIAERSVAEMHRVGPFAADKARLWLDLMLQAFPDVQPGDRLSGIHDGDGAVSFFHNGEPTALIRDPEYARLFFGIWLASKTSVPSLRQALLGAPARCL